MAEANNASGKLYTLTEVSKRTKISMPTLQRYKKMFNDRIPSSGDGRSQRYPEAAIEIFNQLKTENSKKRGRPRKNAVQGGAAAAAKAAAPKAVKAAPANAAKAEAEEPVEPGMLSLKDIEDQTNISYPTLLRYLKTSLKRIPHKGSGRRRRFPPEAVAVFKTLKEESRRGRKAGSGKTAGKTAGKVAAKPAPAKEAPKAAKQEAPKAAKMSKAAAAAAAAAPKVKGKPGRKPKAAAAPAPPAAPKRRGRPPKNPAAVAASAPAAMDPGFAAQLKELTKTIAALQKQVNKLEAELQKPFKVVLKR